MTITIDPLTAAIFLVIGAFIGAAIGALVIARSFGDRRRY